MRHADATPPRRSAGFTFLAAALIVIGCTANGPSPSEPRETSTPPASFAPPASTVPPASIGPSAAPAFEPSPVPFPEVSSATDDVLAAAGSDGTPGLVTCGTDFVFDVNDLDAPTGAQDRAGPEFDALRQFLRDDRDLLGPNPGANPEVREIAREDGRVAFLMERADPGPWSGDGGPFLYVYFNRLGGTWHWAGSGDCQPRAWGPAGYVGAQWALDPAFATPKPSTRVVHVLVSERQCSGGKSVSGRIGPAYVVVDRYEVHIEILVRARARDEVCRPASAAPATLELPTPLGDRGLHDTNEHLGSGTGG
jgi:hypothetical protein